MLADLPEGRVPGWRAAALRQCRRVERRYALREIWAVVLGGRLFSEGARLVSHPSAELLGSAASCCTDCRRQPRRAAAVPRAAELSADLPGLRRQLRGGDGVVSSPFGLSPPDVSWRSARADPWRLAGPAVAVVLSLRRNELLLACSL